MFTKLWNDETGAVITAELVVVSTIVVIGAITGLSTTRDAIVTELGDLATAVATIDQSFGVSSTQAPSAFTAGAEFIDQQDPGDMANAPAHPRGIIVCNTAFPNNVTSEGRNPGLGGGGGGGGKINPGISNVGGKTGGGSALGNTNVGGKTNPGAGLASGR